MPGSLIRRSTKSYVTQIQPDHVALISKAKVSNFEELEFAIKGLTNLRGVGLPEPKEELPKEKKEDIAEDEEVELPKDNVFKAIAFNSLLTTANKLELFSLLLFDKEYVACDAYVDILTMPIIGELLKMSEFNELIFSLFDIHICAKRFLARAEEDEIIHALLEAKEGDYQQRLIASLSVEHRQGYLLTSSRLFQEAKAEIVNLYLCNKIFPFVKQEKKLWEEFKEAKDVVSLEKATTLVVSYRGKASLKAFFTFLGIKKEDFKAKFDFYLQHIEKFSVTNEEDLCDALIKAEAGYATKIFDALIQLRTKELHESKDHVLSDLRILNFFIQNFRSLPASTEEYVGNIVKDCHFTVIQSLLKKHSLGDEGVMIFKLYALHSMRLTKEKERAIQDGLIAGNKLYADEFLKLFFQARSRSFEPKEVSSIDERLMDFCTRYLKLFKAERVAELRAVSFESKELAEYFFKFLIAYKSAVEVVQFANDWIKKGKSPEEVITIYETIKGLFNKATLEIYGTYFNKMAKNQMLLLELNKPSVVGEEKKESPLQSKNQEAVKQFLATPTSFGFFKSLFSTSSASIHGKIQKGCLSEAKEDLSKRQEDLVSDLKEKAGVWIRP